MHIKCFNHVESFDETSFLHYYCSTELPCRMLFFLPSKNRKYSILCNRFLGHFGMFVEKAAGRFFFLPFIFVVGSFLVN